MKDYDHKEIEKKWQKKWSEEGLYETTDQVPGKENFYMLVEFPYPSGNLHVGHWYAFAVADIFARFNRMQGKNVLFPVGFDAFGLPAENAAIKRNLNPGEWTQKNVEFMRAQFEQMGGSFDWSRKVVTSDPDYYKWTQWIITKFFEKGLLYKSQTTVNWCPSCKTVLANEQVVAGLCERCDTELERREMEDWKIKITDYAERLLSDLDKLDWPEEIKESQRNWIGRSEGAEIEFEIKGKEEKVRVFTTRADTIFGATYLVISPEHELLDKLRENQDSVIKNEEEVLEYVEKAKKKTEIERTAEGRAKTGVELEDIKAINPVTGEEIPVWVADYVLANVGTGAVMAVPAHDERDFEFAKKYGLEVRTVIEPVTGEKHHAEEQGRRVVVLVENPDNGKILSINWGSKYGGTLLVGGGLEDGEKLVECAKREVREETGYVNLEHVETSETVHHHYYASVKDKHRCIRARGLYFKLIDDEKLEPELTDYEKGKFDVEWISKEDAENEIKDPLHKYVFEKFINKKAYMGEGVLTNSGEFDGMDSKEAREEITQEFGERKVTYRLRDWSVGRQRYWGTPMPIVYDPDGKPHAVPEEHLPWLLPKDTDFKPTGEPPLQKSKELRERTEEIFGKGWKPAVETLDTFVDSSWYFLRYLDPTNAKSFSDKEKQSLWMPVDVYSGGAEHTTLHLLYSRFFQKALFDQGLVTESEPYKKRMNRGLILDPDGRKKMSKSKGNVIDPDDVVSRLGSDTVRTYLAFIGPYNEVGSYPWDPDGIVGVRRFLERVWKLSKKVGNGGEVDDILFNRTIKKVGEDIASMKLNTGVSQLMILINDWEKRQEIPTEKFKIFLKLLAPYAPHVSEELWRDFGEKESVHTAPWPNYDQGKLESEDVIIAAQVNGKVRAEIETQRDTDQEEVEKQALSDKNVSKWLSGKEIKKVIYIPGKLINFVV